MIGVGMTQGSSPTRNPYGLNYAIPSGLGFRVLNARRSFFRPRARSANTARPVSARSRLAKEAGVMENEARWLCIL